MEMSIELSLEQKFNLKLYEEQIRDLSPEQSRTFLLEVMRQLMVKENMIKHLVKQAC
jgi:Phycobilisome degradation protein nblA